MKHLLYLFILLTAFASCKKKSTYTDPSGARTTFAASMAGEHIWMGTQSSGSSIDTESFTPITINVLNDRTVMINTDTFKYTGYDASSEKITYKYSDYSIFKYLYFNTADNSLELKWSGKNTAGLLTTKNYHYNSSLRDYTPNITGAKTLSGTVYDWFVIRTPPDSNYAVTTTINFKAVNESTISFDKGPLSGYGTLHYKLTDDAAKTIVFQTYHTYYNSFSTLTYNYETKAIVFEQRDNPFGMRKNVKLQ